MYCHTCVKAYPRKKIMTPNLDWAYISTGYGNWKDATVSFAKHQQSMCHKDAVLQIISAGTTIPDVGERLSSQHSDEKIERRKYFMKILQNVRFLARQGLPLRGDMTEDDSNFNQLLRLRSIDDSGLCKL